MSLTLYFIQTQLQIHMAQTFEKIPIVETALHYLKRFDRYVLLCT